MGEKDYLKRGDLKKIAEALGEDYGYVRQVASGHRQNKRISDAIEQLSQKRKESHDKAILELVEDTETEAVTDFKKPD
jgi:hypothetical protein